MSPHCFYFGKLLLIQQPTNVSANYSCWGCNLILAILLSRAPARGCIHTDESRRRINNILLLLFFSSWFSSLGSFHWYIARRKTRSKHCGWWFNETFFPHLALIFWLIFTIIPQVFYRFFCCRIFCWRRSICLLIKMENPKGKLDGFFPVFTEDIIFK